MQKMLQMLSKFHNSTNEYNTISLNDDTRVLLKKLHKHIIEDDLVSKLSSTFIRSTDDYYRHVTSRYPERLVSQLSLNEEGVPTPSMHYNKQLFETVFDERFIDQDFIRTIHNALNNLLGISNKNISFTINVQRPGQCTYVHYDMSMELATKEELKDAVYLPNKCNRGVIFFEDWQDGHVCQLGKDLLKWKKLDSIRYWDQVRLLHGFANFGVTDRVSMCVTWDK